MYLFWSAVGCDFDLGDINEFLEGDLGVEVGIEELEDRLDVLLGDLML